MVDVSKELRVVSCRQCGNALGVSTTHELRIGTAVFKRVVSLDCLCCGRARTWRPGESEEHLKKAM
jgi:RNase P subunit RPR2